MSGRAGPERSSVLPGMPHLGVYRLVVADPPWAFDAGFDSIANGAASASYQTESLEVLKSMPVGSLVSDAGGLLAMWSTGAMSCDGKHTELARAWGAQPCTLLFDWLKGCRLCDRCGHEWADHDQPKGHHLAPGACFETERTAVCRCDGFLVRPDPGQGSYTMQSHEQVWLFRWGDGFASSRARRDVRQTLILPPDPAHSRKPEAMQDLLEAMWPDLTPRLELFDLDWLGQEVL